VTACTQVSAMRTLGSRNAFTEKGPGTRRARDCGRIAVDAVTGPPTGARNRHLVWLSTRYPVVDARTKLILMLYLDINGVDLRYGSTAGQGRTEEKVPHLGCGASNEPTRHPREAKAHQLAPRGGWRQGGEMFL